MTRLQRWRCTSASQPSYRCGRRPHRAGGSVSASPSPTANQYCIDMQVERVDTRFVFDKTMCSQVPVTTGYRLQDFRAPDIAESDDCLATAIQGDSRNMVGRNDMDEHTQSSTYDASPESPITRRAIIRDGLRLGLSLPTIAALLSACGGSSTASTATSASASSTGVSGAPPTTAGVPVGGSPATVATSASGTGASGSKITIGLTYDVTTLDATL